MSQVELKYGRGSVRADFDDGRFRVLAPDVADERPLTDAEIGAALDNPLDSQPLEEIVSPGESALVVVSDATRATASASIIHLLVRRLVQLGVAPYDLRVIFATGLHRRVSAAERRELLTPFVVQRVRTLDHDPHDPERHVSLGVTERGTPVELNRALLDFSHVVLTGGVGFHYFAGFTGGRKSVCPGLASARTIEATHLLALDTERGGRRAGVGTGRLDGNAVHEECERIAAEVAPSFLVNAVVDERGQPVRIYAGDWRAAHRLACAEYADTHTITIAEKRPLVVVSAGGFPHDLNLIQAHKALEMAAHACTEGGSIVLLAECPDGMGRPDFLKWFEAHDTRELESRLLTAYEVNGQTAWSLLTKAERFRVHLVSSLPAEEVRRMRMRPAATLADALRQTPADADGYVMPRGAAFMPVAGGGPASAETFFEPGVH
jgi:nickel-dependent lactate racemase